MSELKPVRKAVFPVAGLGTRFLPATKAVPKEMLTVLDKPVIQYAVDEARKAGIEHFIFVTGRNKAVIEDHFDLAYELQDTLEKREKVEALETLSKYQPGPGETSFTRQQAPLGLGHAVWCARELVGDEPFALLLPDMVMKDDKGCTSGMIDLYNQTGGNIIATEEVAWEETHQYGVIEKGEKAATGFEVTGMVEKPAPYGHVFEGETFDCGSKAGFIRANIAYALDDKALRGEVLSDLKKWVLSRFKLS